MNQENLNNSDILKVVTDVIESLDKDREREIISRRFGINERKETLEQIGEILGITRERVRQLEKIIIIKLKDQASKKPSDTLIDFESKLSEIITKEHGIARILKIASIFSPKPTKIDQSRIMFLCQISSKFNFLPDDDNYYASVVDQKYDVAKDIKPLIDSIVTYIQNSGKPLTIDQITSAKTISLDKKFVQSLTSSSKLISSLNGLWGLNKWPTVNPKNIRDKIYVTLKNNGKHMHFSEIAEQIRKSDFKRNNVTTQAIHNELIKDKRFILIGRGIYALKEWGYSRGTVSDIITEILKEANKPLHKDEIVKMVLKSRFVKETTILLNLQGKSRFKRVAKATYALVED
jgi:hypothetical protein